MVIGLLFSKPFKIMKWNLEEKQYNNIDLQNLAADILL